MVPKANVAGVTEADQSLGTSPSQSDQSLQALQSAQSGPSSEDAVASNGFTVSSFFGFFNVLVGLMLVAAFLTFFGGLIGYLSRLGLENRVQGLYAMYWGTTILFVLVILLTIVNFLQYHTTFFLAIVAIIVAVLFAWGVIAAMRDVKPAKPAE